jgi:hypothetical protein
VVAEQVPVARALRADLLSFHAGPNDVLRPGRDVGAVVHRYDAAVGDLHQALQADQGYPPWQVLQVRRLLAELR